MPTKSQEANAKAASASRAESTSVTPAADANQGEPTRPTGIPEGEPQPGDKGFVWDQQGADTEDKAVLRLVGRRAGDSFVFHDEDGNRVEVGTDETPVSASLVDNVIAAAARVGLRVETVEV